MKNKIIVILGPTASGKTGLAIDVAIKYNGEIISADSRQVYRGMDIGSGKDLPDYRVVISPEKKSELIQRGLDVVEDKGEVLVNVPYHLIDVADPNDEYSLGEYYKQAKVAIEKIQNKGRQVIIAGGTGLWLQALVDGYNLSAVKADATLREELEKLSVEEVYTKLQNINQKFADELNNSEKNNKRRLIRYIEIFSHPQVSPKAEETLSKNGGEHEFILLGLEWPKEILHERIYKRIIDRLENQDMIGEVSRLHDSGVTWKRLESFGLEYKFIALYLQEKIDYDQMVEQLFTATRQFAKRQMSWFRRWEKQGAKIHWLKDKREAEQVLKNNM